MLIWRPHKEQWRCVIFVNKVHYCTGPKHTKNIKQKPGEINRQRSNNIQWESKGKKKAGDSEMDKQDFKDNRKQWFHIFMAIGYNFCWAMQYDAGNSNGKMNSLTFIRNVLPRL